MGFLEILEAQGTTILDQWAPRARLGLHIILAELSDKISEALIGGDEKQAARLISAYFVESGLNVKQVSGVIQLGAYLELLELNNPRWLLPFQKWESPPTKPIPYDYPGRSWAWVVHKLASRYGWTRDEIFNLWPEEAAAYLQEIFISEYDESDEARSLSEVAYHYDKFTKKATFRPLPRPGWMVDGGGKPKTIRIRKDMLPQADKIIKLSDLRPKDDTVH